MEGVSSSWHRSRRKGAHITGRAGKEAGARGWGTTGPFLVTTPAALPLLPRNFVTFQTSTSGESGIQCLSLSHLGNRGNMWQAKINETQNAVRCLSKCRYQKRGRQYSPQLVSIQILHSTETSSEYEDRKKKMMFFESFSRKQTEQELQKKKKVNE